MNPLLMLAIAVAALVACVFAVKSLGGNALVIADWRKAWKFYSVWGIAVLGAIPDIYNALIGSGFLGGDDSPNTLTWSVRIAAISVLILRLVNQQKPKSPFDPSDRAGA